ANRSFYKIFKLKQEDTEGLPIYEVANGRWNIDEFQEMLDDVITNNNQINGKEFQYNFEGIGQKFMLVNARSVLQKNQRQQVIIVAIEDITEHRQGEKIIAEREQMFRNMCDNAPVMLWVADFN